jgi:hypothetical protein
LDGGRLPDGWVVGFDVEHGLVRVCGALGVGIWDVSAARKSTNDLCDILRRPDTTQPLDAALRRSLSTQPVGPCCPTSPPSPRSLTGALRRARLVRWRPPLNHGTSGVPLDHIVAPTTAMCCRGVGRGQHRQQEGGLEHVDWGRGKGKGATVVGRTCDGGVKV